MNVTREVILDLLPVYLSGEASPDTRSLIEEYMKQDPELAQRIRLQWSDNLAQDRAIGAPSGSGVAIVSSHPTPAGLAEVALWIRNILHRHVVQQ